MSLQVTVMCGEGEIEITAFSLFIKKMQQLAFEYI